ncbi:MAG: hypothetical protein AB8B85_11970 [Paracoccaceae bacterium]
MSTIKTLTLAAFAAATLSVPAFATVTVENKTDQAHTVTFDLGSEEKKHEAEPGATVSEACPEGCGVRFAGHDRMATDGDKLAILPGKQKPLPID